MAQRANLHLIAEDLGKQKLADVMRANGGWDPTAQTVILAEGLLMYLSAEAVSDLFGQCAAIKGNASRMVFTYINRGGDGRPDIGRWTRLVQWIIKVSGEPWLWSIQPAELGPFLDKNGWMNAPDLVGIRATRCGVVSCCNEMIKPSRLVELLFAWETRQPRP